MRLIRAENDIADLETKVSELYEQLTAALENLTEEHGFKRDISARVQTLQTIVDKHLASSAYLRGADAQTWIKEMHDACRQVKDGTENIHAWQNQMAKDFSASLCRINKLADKVRELKEGRLKLAALADDRMADLERQLAEATEHSTGVVSRMEQLETRLVRLEQAPMIRLGPNRTVHIPETIHCGGPLTVKLEPPRHTCDLEAGRRLRDREAQRGEGYE